MAEDEKSTSTGSLYQSSGVVVKGFSGQGLGQGPLGALSKARAFPGLVKNYGFRHTDSR